MILLFDQKEKQNERPRALPKVFIDTTSLLVLNLTSKSYPDPYSKQTQMISTTNTKQDTFFKILKQKGTNNPLF